MISRACVNYRAEENGVEWVTGKRTRADGESRECRSIQLAGCFRRDGAFLRIWTPEFAHLDIKTPIDVTIEEAPRFQSARIRRRDPKPGDTSAPGIWPLNLPEFAIRCNAFYERVYALPPCADSGTGKSAPHFRLDCRSGEAHSDFQFRLPHRQPWRTRGLLEEARRTA